MTKPLNIAIAGLGTVGAGTIKLIQSNGALIAGRSGRPLQLVAVSARNRDRDRGVDLSQCRWFDDPVAMAAAPDIDVVVELIGGQDGPAKDATEAAFRAGRSVVTANKALIAHHGMDLARRAESVGVDYRYEAAVAGGIPIIKALREGLAGNEIRQVYGILNGTCNYILTTMRETGRGFDDVLREAQRLGYAEADPEVDVDGIDAAHKLAILTSLAFGTELDFDHVTIEGIRRISAADIAHAADLGYRIKLLGIARRTDNGIEQRVQPVMVPLRNPIANVEDVFNAVLVEGDFIDRTVYVGRGAGAGPTASAVVGDLVDLARGLSVPVFGRPLAELRPAQTLPMDRYVGAYYLPLIVQDRPGVLAAIASILADEQVSIGSVLQRERAPEAAVPVVIATHDTTETAIRRALTRLEELPSVLEPPRFIRMESL